MHVSTPRTRWRNLFGTLASLSLISFVTLPVHPPTVEPSTEELTSGKPFLYRIQPEARGGEAYKLIYLAAVPIDVFWRFKTDFNNNFLLTHKFIEEHRFVRQEDSVVITENRYLNSPRALFRWRTTLHPAHYRLEFVLENPKECGQKFHYGSVQLEPLGHRTKVTHVAYFDFWGASLWANYPWTGGMAAFLRYTARWEQETIVRLKDEYVAKAEK